MPRPRLLRPAASLLLLGCAADPWPAAREAARGELRGAARLSAAEAPGLQATAAHARAWRAAEAQRAALAQAEPAALAEGVAAARTAGDLHGAALQLALGLRAYPGAEALRAERAALEASPMPAAARAEVEALLAEAYPEDPERAAVHRARAASAARRALLPEAADAALAQATPEAVGPLLAQIEAELWEAPDWGRFVAAADAALLELGGPPAAAPPAGGLPGAVARADAVAAAATAAGLPPMRWLAPWVEAGLGAVDPYGRVIWPAGVSAWRDHHAGEVVGLGLQLRLEGEELRVSPLPGGPAWAAGVGQDEALLWMRDPTGELRFDAVPLEQRGPLAEAAQRGPVGSGVELGLRGAAGERSLALQRAAVPVATVSGGSWPEAGPSPWLIEAEGLAYVRVASMKPTTEAAFDALIEPALGLARGLVLDLRGNGGGDVNAAAQLADRFIAEGLLVDTAGRAPPAAGPLVDPETGAALAPWNAAVPGHALEGLPVVVLVDADTASAAEVLAGALQQRAGALIVGAPTWGKGAAQRLISDPEGRFALQLTNLIWTLPDGRRLLRDGAGGGGLQPDLRVVAGPAAQACADAAARRRAAPSVGPDGRPWSADWGAEGRRAAPGAAACPEPPVADAALAAALLVLSAQGAVSGLAAP